MLLMPADVSYAGDVAAVAGDVGSESTSSALTHQLNLRCTTMPKVEWRAVLAE